MDKAGKVQVLSELFDLINMYYEERDLPTEDNDYFTKLEHYCKVLDLDFNEVKQKFELNNIF